MPPPPATTAPCVTSTAQPVFLQISIRFEVFYITIRPTAQADYNIIARSSSVISIILSSQNSRGSESWGTDLRRRRNELGTIPARLSDLQINCITSRLQQGDPPKLISETENVNIATIYQFRRNIQAFATPISRLNASLGATKKDDTRDKKGIIGVSLRVTGHYVRRAAILALG